MWKAIKRDFISLAWTLAVTYAVGKWAIHVSAMERGYEAFGSEYMLIPVAYIVAWKAINYLFDSLEELRDERIRKERRSREAARV